MSSAPARPTVSVDGHSLTLADVVSVGQLVASVGLADGVRRRVHESQALGEKIATRRAIYGRSTGVGANRDVHVEPSAAQALRLARSHATSAGAPRPRESVRAMLLVRLNQLAAGGSGVDPAVLDGILTMLTLDALPAVHELGSVGTGDLAALATTVLTLAGERSTTPALPTPLTLHAGDALAMMSSNAATLGDAALACARWQSLARASVDVAAQTFAAVRGNAEAFSVAVERVTPFPGVRTVCRSMRDLLDPVEPARIQDPFALRTFAQVHGAFLDALHRLEQVVVAMANAPSENPAFLTEIGDAVHHGGFHAVYLAQALDAALSAAAQSAHTSVARLAMLVEPAYTGLPAFLGDGAAGGSGVMTLEYVAASALGRLRHAAAPVSMDSVVLSRGTEEDASFAPVGAASAASAVERYRDLVSCELVAAIRARRMLGQPVPARYAELPDDAADRDLTGDLAVAAGLLGRI